MRRAFLYILLIGLVLLSCDMNSDGKFREKNVVKKSFQLKDAFHKIKINSGVELVLRDSSDVYVLVEGNRSLIDNTEFCVVDSQLQIFNDSHNTMFSIPKKIKVYLSAPNISEIRNSSQFSVLSNGVLNYPELTLLSEVDKDPSALNIGDFEVKIKNKMIRIISDNISTFSISGETDSLFIECYGGTGRFDSKNLITQNAYIFHRGGNDIVINPQKHIWAQIFGTGDLICIHKPPSVDVTEKYKGKLIFR